MKIGLTYDLRDEYLAAGYDEEATAEFDRADTIESIGNAIRKNIDHVHRVAAVGTLNHAVTIDT